MTVYKEYCMASFQGTKCKSLKELEGRFWSKVDKRGIEECWNFKGAKKNGYGVFWVVSRLVRAHRFAWMIYYRIPIPEGKLILHKCDNPSCCNPNHLYCGTHSDNMNDKRIRNRANPAKTEILLALAGLSEEEKQEVKKFFSHT